MTRNRKGPPDPSVIASMTDREKAVLQVLSDAEEPLDHKQICMRIAEPWYEKRSSFRASVSSTLGVMRSKGLIKARQIPTGDAPIHIKGYQIITPKIRVWEPNGFRQVRAIADTSAFQPVGYHTGGVFDLRDYQRRFLDEANKFNLAPDSGKSLININLSVGQPSLYFRRPITDDMHAMIDDLDRVEETPASRQNRSLLGSIARIKQALATGRMRPFN